LTLRGAIAAAFLLALSAHAAAATFVVNSTLDTDDKSADGQCRDANNKCTLRAAITEANRDPGADVITFGITGTGTKTITISIALSILQPLSIDGTTQSGYAAGAPVIDIDGATTGTNAFVISAPACEIRGLRVERFSGAGVSLVGGANAVIRANHIVGNGLGVEAKAGMATATTLVGGSLGADRNVFSTNGTAILVASGAHDVRIVGNYIGTDATGATLAASASYGVHVDNARAEIRGNVIAGGLFGIALVATTGPIVVADNLIGTDAAGTTAFSCTIGIDVQGGMTEIAGNTISGNSTDGIRLTGPACTGTVIRGNRIGTTASGLTALGNDVGIRIEAGAAGSTIGGADAVDANLISGNDHGIEIYDDQAAFDPSTQTRAHTIRGNAIGVASDGSALRNSTAIRIEGAAQNTIDANTIANSLFGGVVVIGYDALDNAIRRNAIYDNGSSIDLDNDGATQNDFMDLDAGANDHQNFPVISVGSDDTTTWIGGTLDTSALGTFELDFFASPTCGGHYAKQYVGTTTVSTNSNGTATLLVPFPRMPDGTVITATATTESGSTSELSACATASACTPITLFGLADATIGVAYFSLLEAMPPATIHHIELVGGALPPGIVLLPTGELNGIPEVGGTYSFTLAVTDLRGCVTMQTLTLRVCELIRITPDVLESAPPFVPFSVQFTASGGTPPYEYSFQFGPSPAFLPGLSLSASGLLDGTPTLSGFFDFTITAVDQGSCSGSHAYGLDVGCLAMTLLPLNIPIGDLGAPYQVQFTAHGGVPPYRFAAGALPPGLEMSSLGLIAGTPRERGVTDIVVIVTDGIGCQWQDSYTLVVDVSNPPGCECGAGGRPSSLVFVAFVLVVTLRRRRRSVTA
jgi:CSLREA domain-containing protein